MFTVVHVSENKIALKTGYGRYVSVNSAGELTGRAEAIGLRETWDPVFEDVSICLLCSEVKVAIVGSELCLTRSTMTVQPRDIYTQSCMYVCHICIWSLWATALPPTYVYTGSKIIMCITLFGYCLRLYFNY